jgi:type I restriction enzyme S subunit
MRRYEKYKDSGIEWIGEIPEHWESIRLKYIGYLYGGLAGKSANDFNQESNFNNKPFIPFTNICNNKIIDPNHLQQVVIEENEQQNQVAKGDLFFMMSSENFDDVGKSSILLDDLGETYLNSFCKGFRFLKDKYYPPFINYQLLSKAYRSLVLTEANGYTRINLKIDKINDIPLKTPPTLDEQIAIANYLDQKTAEIDELIKQKEELLLLFEDEKSAIIKHAVTKGINTNVELKDSKIDWLGEIPEHWQVKILKYLAKVQTGGTPKIQDSKVDYFFEGNVNWYTPVDFYNDGILSDSNRKINELAVTNNEVEIFPEYSVYLVSIGATLGKVGLSISKATANQQINVISFFESILNPTFGYYFLAGNKEMIKLEAEYTTLPILNQTKTKTLKIAFPSIKEQTGIIQFINNECSRINFETGKINRLIQNLKEYKNALITEVATGKVKVI